ncbi:C-C motif chemokine 25 isoform X3 [Homo sapiens]|uniref:C-C motif chemokine 25 isoform X3 n=1 Tax=Homo sapiens TaxID=9606 RepID=UPI0023DF527E|nr:C-C motif chemokine 25 isoform X3 [Homo sapiens]
MKVRACLGAQGSLSLVRRQPVSTRWDSLAYSPAGISSLDPVDIGGPVIRPGAQGGGPACSMNLWLLACLVAGFLGAWAPAVHTQEQALEDFSHQRTIPGPGVSPREP